jgi:hypothetical protein
MSKNKVKPKPKKIDDYKKQYSGTIELLDFCAKIKHGEIYELTPVIEYIGINGSMWCRMHKSTPEIEKYVCYVRGNKVSLAFVHPKYRLELIESHRAFERHQNESAKK